jgi:phenylpyruvate tautomerase PptA (4-oxalocrotonate tautomerase family)
MIAELIKILEEQRTKEAFAKAITNAAAEILKD